MENNAVFKVGNKVLFNCYSDNLSINQSNKQLRNVHICNFSREMSVNRYQTRT